MFLSLKFYLSTDIYLGVEHLETAVNKSKHACKKFNQFNATFQVSPIGESKPF